MRSANKQIRKFEQKYRWNELRRKVKSKKRKKEKDSSFHEILLQIYSRKAR